MGPPAVGTTGAWRSFDTYKCPKRDETEWRRLPCNPWRQIARLNGLNACIYVEASPRIRRGVVRLLFRRAKDGGAALLHAGSIAAALLRAARALSVQKRHANERDVQKRHGSGRSGAARRAARRGETRRSEGAVRESRFDAYEPSKHADFR